MAVIPNQCKFHVVSDSVNTTDKGSSQFQSQRASVSMQDIIDTIGPDSTGPFEYGSGGDTSIVPKQGTNTATQSFSAVIGGLNNDVTRLRSQIFGGESNTLSALGNDNVILGGRSNQVIGGGAGYNNGGHMVSGGFDNSIDLTTSQNQAPHTIVGGKNNQMTLAALCSQYSYYSNQILGGSYNTITANYGYTQNNTIVGTVYGEITRNVVANGLYFGHNSLLGSCDVSITDSDYSSVIASRGSSITQAQNNVILGSSFSSTQLSAYPNAYNNVNFIIGGEANAINGYTSQSGIIGGSLNTLYGAVKRGAIIGGYFNDMNVLSFDSAIIAGQNNAIVNDRSVIVGGQAITTDRDNTLFCENLSIKGIPTSSAGLPSGSVWSNSGVLNIVP